MSARQTVLETLRAQNQRPISYEQGLELQKKTGAVCYFETCAIRGEGVVEAFNAAALAAICPPPPQSRKCTIM